MKAVGIDIGTTSICGVLIDCETGNIEKSITRNSDAFIKGCEPYEKLQYVDKIIDIATKALDILIKDDVVVIGVTGQMHGIVYTDQNGCAVSHLYTWQDCRGSLPYKDTTYAKYLGSHTGYGNVTDFFNRENGIRPKSAVSYCTIADYLVMRLCGLKLPVIHTSNAASFGLYDIIEKKFNYDFSPTITDDYTIAGTYKGIPVSVAIGDNQASVFSTLANEDNVLVNIGTGSQVSVISDTPDCNDSVEARPYFDGKYLIVGAALCGGRAYSTLKDLFKSVVCHFKEVTDEEIYEVMNKLAAKGGSALNVDSRFTGARNNPEHKGIIRNITPDNLTAENLTSAFVDAISTELCCLYSDIGHEKSGLIASGNGIRKNMALIKAIEKTFKFTLLLPKHVEEAAFGAALYALVACGKFRSAKEAQKLITYRDNSSLMNPMNIGKKISSLRSVKGMTQSDLATYLNVSNKAVSKWETGQGYPDITHFPKLASLFNVTIDYIMGEDV